MLIKKSKSVHRRHICLTTQGMCHLSTAVFIECCWFGLGFLFLEHDTGAVLEGAPFVGLYTQQSIEGLLHGSQDIMVAAWLPQPPSDPVLWFDQECDPIVGTSEVLANPQTNVAIRPDWTGSAIVICGWQLQIANVTIFKFPDPN